MVQNRGTLASIARHGLALARALPADRDPVDLYLSSLGTPQSRRAALAQLDTAAKILSGGLCRGRTLAWHLLRRHHFLLLRQTLSETYSLHTANRTLSIIRSVVREAASAGLLGADDLVKLTSVPNIRGETLPPGRALQPEEVVRLIDTAAATGTARGRRDAAIVALLYATGVRRSELANLVLRDLDRSTYTVTIRRGKGRRDRLTYVGATALQGYVERWIQVRGEMPGPLFCNVTKGDQVVRQRPLSGHRIYMLLGELANRAGIAHTRVHDMRRTMITHLLERGADLETVSRLAGHKHLATTQAYIRRGEESKREAASLLRLDLLPADD